MLATIQSRFDFMYYGGRNRRPPPARAPAFPARERRSRVMNMASLCFSVHQRKALIRNLSLNGMMIETTLPPPEGEIVVVKIEGLAPIWGEVRWRDGGRAGIRFDQPITAENLFVCAIRRPVANDDLIGGTAEAARFQ